MLFDCIEFNEPFRFTDVCADFAFLAMDLEDRGLKCHARRFVSLYLEHTGDYQALELLNFYKAYRAMVRARLRCSASATRPMPCSAAATLRQYRNYANLAEATAPFLRFLAVTHGVSAVGKSQVATCVWWRLWAPCACARMSNASVCSASSRNTTGAVRRRHL